MSRGVCLSLFVSWAYFCSLSEAARTESVSVSGGSQDVPVTIPSSYRPSGPAVPVLIYLHPFCLAGRRGNVVQPALYENFVDSRNYIYAAPKAPTDTRTCPDVICENMVQSKIQRERSLGNQAARETGRGGCAAWGATSACCNPNYATGNDEDYLMRLLSTLKARYNIDPSRVYFTGIANGAVMAQKLACTNADEITAIATYAGTIDAENPCQPSSGVRVLNIHGTRDDVIFYRCPEGGCAAGFPNDDVKYLAAAASVRRRAKANKCDRQNPIKSKLTPQPGRYRSRSLLYSDGCVPNGDVALYTLKGAPHILTGNNPATEVVFGQLSLDWLLESVKPGVSAAGSRFAMEDYYNVTEVSEEVPIDEYDYGGDYYYSQQQQQQYDQRVRLSA